jgi:pimeloyl-ACP methyl ester carboxylesterase
MPAKSNPYLKTMQPWPGLEPYMKRVTLPDSLSLHLFDSAPDGGNNLPAALLVHGLGDDADTWRHLFAALARDRRVVALDLPGFARSDPMPGAYRLPFYRDVLLSLLDTLAIPRATMIGHSLGAMLCQYLAFERPERVERLILLAGSVIARHQQINRELLLYLVPVIGDWQYNRLRKDPQTAYETLRPYYADLDALPEAERAFMFERVNQRVWSDTQRVAFLYTLRSLSRWVSSQRRHLEETLAASTTPTLMVWGDRDAINSLDNGRLAAQIRPDTRLVVVREAGHNLHHEQPQALLQALWDFEGSEVSHASAP